MFDQTGFGFKMFNWQRHAVMGAVASVLVACGGGGGSDAGSTAQADQILGPPTVAASLVNSSDEAKLSMQTMVEGADKAASRASSLSGLSALLGLPVGTLSVASSGQKEAQSTTGVHAMSVQTQACNTFLASPCTGSATLDTNIADNANVINVGDFADVTFASLSGPLDGLNVFMNGHMRIDFLSTFNLNSSMFSGLDLKLKLDNFSGSVNGASFGPVSDSAHMQINAQGVSTVTAGGVSYIGLKGVSVTGAGTYTIPTGTLRVSYWSDSGKYVDIALTNWRTVGGKPQVGAHATVTSSNGTITANVTSSNSTTVVYAVTCVVNGITSRYTVTATYGAGSTSPTYVAVPA